MQVAYLGFIPKGRIRQTEDQPDSRLLRHVLPRAVPSPARRLWRRVVNPSCESLKINIYLFRVEKGLGWIPEFQELSLFCKGEK